MQALTVTGIRLGVARAGIKYPDRRDLVVIEAAPGTQAAPCLPAMPFAPRR